jgi:thiol-disulfide isomerase/thioredoxin
VTRYTRPVILGSILGVALTLAAQQPATPKLTPLTLDGYNKLVAAHKGRVVLATFWATYCIPCRAEIPELVKLAAQLRPRGLDLVVVSGDDPDRAAAALKFIAPKVPAGPLYIKSSDDDDKYAAGIHARWQGELPANFVYDRTGRKVGAFMGEVPTKNIQDVIEKFL